MDLASLTPTARTLWWYMVATGAQQEIREIAARSGIPLSSIYAAAARYPQTFALTGSLVRHATPATPPESQGQEAQA